MDLYPTYYANASSIPKKAFGRPTCGLFSFDSVIAITFLHFLCSNSESIVTPSAATHLGCYLALKTVLLITFLSMSMN